MIVEETSLPGVLVLTPDVFADERGFFKETWNSRRYASLGIPWPFVQDNVSLSRKGVLRGLHYQNPTPQGKLISVLSGEVFDVAVDIRTGSPGFGRWVSAFLSSENHRQIYIPPGCAHGFVVLSDQALVTYKATDYYNPGGEGAILWDDPDLGIRWPIEAPLLSPKDAAAPRLREVPREKLVPYMP